MPVGEADPKGVVADELGSLRLDRPCPLRASRKNRKGILRKLTAELSRFRGWAHASQLGDGVKAHVTVGPVNRQTTLSVEVDVGRRHHRG